MSCLLTQGQFPVHDRITKLGASECAKKISEHLYVKNHHTLNANRQSIFAALIIKNIIHTITLQSLCA